ncbi:unnamed protein product [Boreogadus saida]
MKQNTRGWSNIEGLMWTRITLSPPSVRSSIGSGQRHPGVNSLQQEMDVGQSLLCSHQVEECIRGSLLPRDRFTPAKNRNRCSAQPTPAQSVLITVSTAVRASVNSRRALAKVDGTSGVIA